jgi:hypothetical protein
MSPTRSLDATGRADESDRADLAVGRSRLGEGERASWLFKRCAWEGYGRELAMTEEMA